MSQIALLKLIEDITNFILLSYLFCGLHRYFKGIRSDLREYIEPDLNSNGFKFIQSKNYYKKDFNPNFETPVGEKYLNPGAGPYVAPIFSTYSFAKKVTLKDRNGNNRQILAVVIFKGFIKRTYVGTAWQPSLRFIKTIST